jgi:hypothetical protein
LLLNQDSLYRFGLPWVGRSGGGQGGLRRLVRTAVEEHIFDVTGRIEVFFALGDAF